MLHLREPAICTACALILACLLPMLTLERPVAQSLPQPAATAPAVKPPAAQTATPTPTVIKAQVTDEANLRSGPGTDYEIVGRADAGQEVTIVGVSTAGDWYQLDDGMWIAASLLGKPSTPVPTPPMPTPNARVTAAAERKVNAVAAVFDLRKDPIAGSVD